MSIAVEMKLKCDTFQRISRWYIDRVQFIVSIESPVTRYPERRED